ncbi:hypothetical protein ACIRRH_42320 [Kitasatospora sp. NPDC101235]|uniref:hypothetical protein n=1 Tax=Kitasatospora sp. NPDC101235 TaxID=3364101 RepID=UPI00382E7D18
MLENTPDLPPPSGKLPRWERHVPTNLLPKQYEPGLWEIARRYREHYFLPRALPEEYQEQLRRARAAARAIQDAPSEIAEELLYRRPEPLVSPRLLLEERLLLLARTLQTADEDPAFDAEADCEPFIGILEARAAEGFDLALGRAEAIDVVIADELHLDWPLYAVARHTMLDVSFAPMVEHVVCGCGKSRWLVILIDGHGAIACACGRLRWEPRLKRETMEQVFPGKLTRLPSPSDLDRVAEFGPFRHKW